MASKKGKKYVFFFRPGKAEGKGNNKNLLGGKGAGLAEMCNLGIPVPSGFTISTEACIYYFKNGNKWPVGLQQEVDKNMAKLESGMGARFGDRDNPLLVSVRSGARASMPGMMDTVLNLGLNDKTIAGLIKRTDNPRFVYDSYRRFIHMFSDVVLGVEKALFEKELSALKQAKGVDLDMQLDADALIHLCERYKEIFKAHTGKEFPQDPKKQLQMAINAVFGSWNNKRAKDYRRLYNIPEDWGTAVNVQAMVFGNSGDKSGTGVAFTRSPSTGENVFFGEFLVNAQGEDVVAGIRTPLSIDGMGKTFPQAADKLRAIAKRLENHYRDMLDLEFTIQEETLYMLQSRVGKRTAASAIKIAHDMVQEKRIKREEAVLRIHPSQIDQLLHKTIDPKATLEVLTTGLPASPGAAVGRVVFSSEEAIELHAKGEPALLVRYETSPEDLAGMSASEGILTVHGGMTSHAAVVARGMGKCCVAGAGEIEMDEEDKTFSVKGVTVRAGDWLTLDGSAGRVILGSTDLVSPTLTGEFGTIMQWADKFRRLKIRANADTPEDATLARKFGAEGIGLCRTEHMFFAEDRILAVRQMIVSDTDDQRAVALQKLLPMQKNDFIGILEAMQGLPVTIRLLDPPLHEFLPKTKASIEKVAEEMGISADAVERRVEALSEANPMLGHRGCRLGITLSAIYEMQVRAIFEATAELKKRKVDARPEVMIPLVGIKKELEICKEMVIRVGKEVQKAEGVKFPIEVGTMIELPRACLVADQIAEEAEFFSFGTNDLTQTTLGLSRDDAGSFLPHYVERGILPYDPFASIDEEGVGSLMKLGIQKGRKVKPKLKIGICGEHGGDPRSVSFCHAVGLNYVSCSPYRVPIARLAAAHAALGEKRK
ncbi:MAG: pyruvate, phosphate dikinase [Deltaproteobacteria bacterium]|nr:pyruvate, phosphate dikinase [Deltaproteobacteria bacterium]